MKNTTYFGLNKPERSDTVKVSHFNANADIIDSIMYQLLSEKANVTNTIPASRTINGYDLTADRTLTVVDLGLTNKNKLINSDFRNPINQRGQSVYRVTDSAYALDMCMAQNMTVTIADGYINISAISSSAVQRFRMRFEGGYQLGRPYTVSMLARVHVHGSSQLRATDGYADMGETKPITQNTTDWEMYTITITPSKNVVESGMDIISSSGTCDIDIMAIKVEPGNTQTLARKVDGVWKPLDPLPNYSIELAKCKRYFRRIQGIYDHFGAGYFMTNTYAYLFCPLDVPMRINPTVTLHGAVYLWSTLGNGANAKTSAALTASHLGATGGNCLYLSLGVSGATAGLPCSAQFRDAVSYIDLSAEL